MYAMSWITQRIPYQQPILHIWQIYECGPLKVTVHLLASQCPWFCHIVVRNCVRKSLFGGRSQYDIHSQAIFNSDFFNIASIYITYKYSPFFLFWRRHVQNVIQILQLHEILRDFRRISYIVTENPFICHIMNLLWSLGDKGTRVRFCWVPSHCGIDGNERVDQLAKETLDQDIDPLASVHYTDMKPLVNSYIQKMVQTKWDVAVHGRDLYLVKPTLGPPKKFQHPTRAEEVVITRLRIGHTKATKAHILSRGPPTGWHHYGQTLTIDHMLLECALLQECRNEYYTVDSLNALFETIPETFIVEFLREAEFFYLIWCNLLTSTSPQTFTIWSDLSNYLENESNSETHLLV